MDSRSGDGGLAAQGGPLPRTITASDTAGLSRMLARAFFDDPISVYLFPSERSRIRRLERYFRFQIRTVFLPKGEGWATGDLASAAFWLPPRSSARPPTLAEALAQVPALFILGRGTSRAIELVRLLESNHPTRPHWYLATIGTEPDRQGQGLGSALLGEVLAKADADLLPSYLESSKEQNLAFYEGHGFVVRGKATLPGTAVRLWFMWREPRRERPGRSDGPGREAPE